MQRDVMANTLERELGLSEPPVALSFLEAPPPGVPRDTEPSPSACTFWKRGRERVLYATADDHAACPVGLLTMGFPLSERAKAEANQLVGTMASLHYFDPAEVAHLPAIGKPHSVVVYGPLGSFPVEPDFVLLALDARRAMLMAEALGGVAWAEQPALGAFGRPACAAIPKAEKLGAATMSLGCIGARTYVGLPDDALLLVVPGSRLAPAVERLPVVLAANRALEQFHQQRKSAVAAS